MGGHDNITIVIGKSRKSIGRGGESDGNTNPPSKDNPHILGCATTCRQEEMKNFRFLKRQPALAMGANYSNKGFSCWMPYM